MMRSREGQLISGDNGDAEADFRAAPVVVDVDVPGLNPVEYFVPFSEPLDPEGSANWLDEIDRPLRTPTASAESLAAARELADSSRRRIDTPVRKSFVRPRTSSSNPVAPLADIYRGGRSGVVAVKLYLALLWRCSTEPFSTDKPARAWATLLDLEDPEGNGTRRVKSALRILERAQLIQLTAQPGYPNVVTLLDESGTGRSYTLPSTAYTFAARNAGRRAQQSDAVLSNTYFKVPQQLWRKGFIQTLSGPGLVMLLILLAEQGGEGSEVWFSTDEFPQRYNISHKTRAAGTKELVELGLLAVEAENVGVRTRSTFDVRRRRKVYRLTPRAQAAPAERVTPTSTRRRKRKPTQA